MTGFLLVTMYAAMVAASHAFEVLFSAAGLIPAEHTRIVEASVQWNYTTILNTHFSAGDAADIVAFSPTSFNKAPYDKAGDLADLRRQEVGEHI